MRFMDVMAGLALLLAHELAFAENVYMQYGLGITAPDANSVADVKLAAVGYQADLGLIDYRIEFGGWFDNSGYRGAKNSGYGALLLGVEPELNIKNFGGLYVNWFSGVGAITTPDSLLSSAFQFFHDASIGLQDSRGVRIGLHYKHISNAGITEPNRGRDFFGIDFAIPIGN